MLIFDQLNREDRPLRLLAALLLAGLLLLVGGLWYVQVVNAKRYQEELQDQAVRTVRLPAVRGKILDRNGLAIAENRASYSANLYLSELSKSFKKEYDQIRPPKSLTAAQIEAFGHQARFMVVSNYVAQISAYLGEPRALDDARIVDRHYQEQRALPFPILENLQPKQVAIFEERPPRVPGVALEIQSTRVYPGGPSTAHLVGILRRDDSSAEDEDSFFHYRLPDFRGHTGIEGMFDAKLRGRAGVKTMMVNRLGYRQSETLQTAPETGQNIVLTIDLLLQQKVEEALLSAFGTNTRGAAVVMDARNGDVLAMTSAPSYDPEIWLHRISTEQMEYLNQPKLRPQLSRVTQENYRPGSIFKIVVALAALEQGVLDPNEQFQSEGRYKLPGIAKAFKDTQPPGSYNFRLGFIKSSNTYFITQGMKPGVLARVIDLGHRLHFGERTGVLPTQETAGTFPGPRELAKGWDDVKTCNLSIGQGPIDVTPLQIAVMITAVANGGTVYWPRLVERIESPDPATGEPTLQNAPARIRDHLNVSEKSLRIVREAMEADVSAEGSGKFAMVQGLRICAKTGTAENEEGGQMGEKTTWFASYAPAESPRFVVVVMVEGGSFGGTTCAPVAGKIYRELKARYLNSNALAMAQVK